ncbi:hypothetical protein NN561_013521 [Cricetulus griseus]
MLQGAYRLWEQIQMMAQTSTQTPMGRARRRRPFKLAQAYPIAQGDRQSLINIISNKAVHSPSLQPLELFYEACMSLSITNNGHSVQVDFNDGDDRTVVTAPPPPRKGPIASSSSTSTRARNTTWAQSTRWTASPSPVSYIRFTGMPRSTASTFRETAAAPDGLAVVDVFLTTGDEHPSMNRLTDTLYMVRFKDTKAQFNYFNPKGLLHTSLHYWTYPGSLTTPPAQLLGLCSGSPSESLKRQMEKFRSLLFTSEDG